MATGFQSAVIQTRTVRSSIALCIFQVLRVVIKVFGPSIAGRRPQVESMFDV